MSKANLDRVSQHTVSNWHRQRLFEAQPAAITNDNVDHTLGDRVGKIATGPGEGITVTGATPDGAARSTHITPCDSTMLRTPEVSFSVSGGPG
ncbi:hypothetical protein [Arthrobacter sp. ok909]|uniref:hypothetical protein n=1 Tax=Arthrobacter sp. ok909 TaxID=1761746 RepID=UPI000B889CDD|nr:hypothetical protein [Arthrobacter sp. ok909]